jgi:RNA polymerase sigma-70 factor (ECF subfamily)
MFRQKSRTAEFEAAALPHLNDLFRTASRLLGDRAKAEDVVQEVYLQAWRSFDRFEVGTNCRAWLFKILFHSIHHFRRKWFNLKIVKESDEFLEQSVASAPPVPDRLTDEEILSALDRIPQDFKAVVMLADVEEFSYKEIAEILKIPVGTVMSRLSRGRGLLRGYLAGVAQSYGIRRAGQEGQAK